MNALVEALLRRAPAVRDIAPKIERLIHTSSPAWQDSELGAAAFLKDRSMQGFHVTDNPGIVKGVLASGGSLRSADRWHPELGTGLYISDAPQYWSGRSTSKWDFLKNLDDQQKTRLLDELTKEVDELNVGKRLTENEYEMGTRHIGHVREGRLPPGILVGALANQPFNIRFSEPGYLAKLGIPAAKQPDIVPVKAKGLFAEMNRHLHDEEAQALLDAGVQGAFTRSGWSTNPEMVIWDANAVREFGDWRRPRNALAEALMRRGRR